MKRTRSKINTMDLIESYAATPQGNGSVSEMLWDQYGTATRAVIADGCRVLAMLWDSAWSEGNGRAIDEKLLEALPENDIIALYSDQQFLPSLSLDEISTVL